jgi:hypothetical protein
MYKLYYLTSSIDEYKPRYVGYASDIKKRRIDHLYEAKYNKSKSHKVNWIKKLITENVELIIVEICKVQNLEDTLSAEIKLVAAYKTLFNLTNSTSGGESSKSIIKDVKKKISESLKKYYSINSTWNKGKTYSFSKERNRLRRERIGDKISGENNHFWGKSHSDETRRILSKKNRIHDYTYESIFDLYIRKNMTGVEISERLNISYIAIKKAIQRYNLRPIKEEIYGKIKGNKDVKEVDFEIYFDDTMY